jgi:hypothetical protein
VTISLKKFHCHTTIAKTGQSTARFRLPGQNTDGQERTGMQDRTARAGLPARIGHLEKDNPKMDRKININ